MAEPATNEACPPVGGTPAPSTGPSSWEQRSFSQRAVDSGFLIGLLLAFLCFVIAAWYLISYQLFAIEAATRVGAAQSASLEGVGMHIYLARVLLQSCGLATGMAFGFLGFSLFLLGIGGSMDASASQGTGASIQLARVSPGAFVMLCASVLVGICATSRIPTRLEAPDRAKAAADNNMAGGDEAGTSRGSPYPLSPNISSDEMNELNEVIAAGGVNGAANEGSGR